ncbi:MAG TPA: bifunctional phosphoribosylaminoimidazolecarboxamide formyltransferase/inosine monophosphate cyclohydrolase [Candidatus Omnitrophica bacterium]|nr:bifunctional phosphoribosylaminoimidazolecarboxamide formyltransferase/inosine monophosphate cyclohydrolase [Candidatus Omnitrophota bacterium]
MLKIKRALISVSDKTGIVELAGVLNSFGVEIISTGGTARALKSAGLPVIEMSDYTGFPEMLDGRVKTLHPKIHGGLLSLRDDPEHMKQIGGQQIGLIDMVVVNLYPFEETVERAGVALSEAVENIDIGGPSMLRSAAKNYKSVAVVPDAKFYGRVIAELKENDGCLSESTLEGLALEVFKRTSRYDSAIAGYLSGELKGLGGEAFPPEALSLDLKLVSSLRYGENPHQKAGLYRVLKTQAPSLISARQLHGKELSFNNYLDLNAAFQIVREFTRPAACIIKHTNPTGVAEGSSLVRAYKAAWQTDSLSAFGGIIGLNRRVDLATAKLIIKSGFMECVLAPGYEPGALGMLQGRKNLRLLEVVFSPAGDTIELDIKKIDGGALVQEKDARDFNKDDIKFVTKKRPTKKQIEELLFAWKVVKHVKSNAIVLARSSATIGIGMGQTSRVDSVFMAVKRAGKRSKGAVMASDAFFPKADNIALAKKAGVRAIIQPGGSIADAEVVSAANRAGISMVFTGFRHFKH